MLNPIKLANKNFLSSLDTSSEEFFHILKIAKNFKNNDLNIQRKIKEIFLSLILEFRYDKQQILKLYLNNIYLGSGAYGVNEASQVYFGKLIEELTLSEIALIAGLAPAPSIYSPYQNVELAIKNRNKVLESMYLDGYISLANKNKAIKEKINLNYQKPAKVNQNFQELEE